MPPPSARPAPTLPPPAPLLRRIAVPAAVTLALTLTRLFAELGQLPGWLASRDAGGHAALLGISWLPPLLGWWFARGLVGRTDHPKRELARTLLAYGLAARLPVVIITAIAEARHWDTHFTKYGPDEAKWPATYWGRIGIASIAQLGFWVVVWTLGSGMLVGWLWLRARERRDVSAPRAGTAA